MAAVEIQSMPEVRQEPEIEEDPEPYPPWNFSWVLQDELACMAWPQNILNLDYLYDVGIRHLITLSPEKIPPIEGYSKIKWTLLAIDEYEDPTVAEITEFIDICQTCRQNKQPIGIHCRMGKGRSGVMATCYLIRFKDMTAQDAIAEIKLLRKNCIETPEQEAAITNYFESLRGGVANSNN